MTATLDLAAPAIAASVERIRRQDQLTEEVRVRTALRAMPLQPAVTLTAIEHQDLPAILAAGLPGVTHSRRQVGALSDEHLFLNPATGEAVRAVLTFDRTTGATRTEIGEVDGCLLWDRLVARCTEWQMTGRQIPEGWTA